jgi:hypothetical protein
VARPVRGQIRISMIHHHPMTKSAIVIISQWTGAVWQLVRSSPNGATLDDPAIQRFLAWARDRYPKAIVREVAS